MSSNPLKQSQLNADKEENNPQNFKSSSTYTEQPQESKQISSNPYVALWQRTFDYKGVASRNQYWIPWLINLGIGIVLGIISRIITGSITTYESLAVASFLGILFGIISLVLSFTLFMCAIRRLHDSNKSGFFVLLGLVPIIGGVIVLIMLVLPTQKEYNRWRDFDKQRGYIKEAE